MSTSKCTKAVGYRRVSTAEQATDGISLDVQAEKIAAYCALHALELLGNHADEGLSGKRADNRPGLQTALEEVCTQGAILVVYSLSRLARSTRDCITIAERLNACGADLASISERLDTSNSMGRFFFTLMAALGQLERDQIAERTVVAMGHLRRQNRRISLVTPYGLDLHADGKTLIVHPGEHAVLDRMKQERQAGISFNAIATRLNAEGIKPKCGRQWYHSSVKSVLVAAGRRMT